MRNCSVIFTAFPLKTCGCGDRNGLGGGWQLNRDLEVALLEQTADIAAQVAEPVAGAGAAIESEVDI
jgi:hypothetical protein